MKSVVTQPEPLLLTAHEAPGRLTTLPEVATVMQVSIRELRRLRASGCFGPTVIALGKRLQRVRRQELFDWINAGCPPATRWTWKGT